MKLYELFLKEYQKGLGRPAKREKSNDQCQSLAGRIIGSFGGSNFNDGDILKTLEYAVHMVTMTGRGEEDDDYEDYTPNPEEIAESDKSQQELKGILKVLGVKGRTLDGIVIDPNEGKEESSPKKPQEQSENSKKRRFIEL